MYFTSKKLSWKVETPVFDGATLEDIKETLDLQQALTRTAKASYTTGRTGEKFEQPRNRWLYVLPQAASSCETIRSMRSTGPYSLQPSSLSGRQGAVRRPALRRDGSLGAGKRAPCIYPAGRDPDRQVRRYHRRVKTHRGDRPKSQRTAAGFPESFKVLTKELQALCLLIFSSGREHGSD